MHRAATGRLDFDGYHLYVLTVQMERTCGCASDAEGTRYFDLSLLFSGIVRAGERS